MAHEMVIGGVIDRAAGEVPLFAVWRILSLFSLLGLTLASPLINRTASRCVFNAIIKFDQFFHKLCILASSW